MLVTLISIAIGLFVLVVFVNVYRRSLWRRACRAGAATIYSDLIATFQGAHEYRVARRDEITGLDWSGYDRVRLEMEERGFALLGGMEDMTMSRVKPELRNFVEVYAGMNGTVTVGTYTVYGVHVVDCMSETPDGRAFVTTNAEMNKLTPPPNWRGEVRPATTQTGELLDLHLARLVALKESESSVQLVGIRSMEDAIESAKRSSRASAEHRRSIGFLTRDELTALTGLDQEATADLVWIEFCRIQQEKRAA